MLVVDGMDTGLVHRSVLDRVAEIADRMGCCWAVRFGTLPTSFGSACLPQLRRELAEIIAFADAALRTGWMLGDLAAAPGDRPVPVLDTPQGRLWVHPVRGFELHGSAGARSISELAQVPGSTRRTALTRLIVPLAEALACARVLEVYEWDR